MTAEHGPSGRGAESTAALTEGSIVVRPPGAHGGLGEITAEDARLRVLAFCTDPQSGWQTYDVMGDVARRAGEFEAFRPWSLQWADALAGQLTVRDLVGFDDEVRRLLVERLGPIEAVPLAEQTDEGVRDLAVLCRTGFLGVWAPKMTKMLALYLPESVPVLDGYVALALGFHREGFSTGVGGPRWARIEQALFELRRILREDAHALAALRASLSDSVPDLHLATDLRLLDIVLWTSQDDQMERPRKTPDRWLEKGRAWEPPQKTPQISATVDLPAQFLRRS